MAAEDSTRDTAFCQLSKSLKIARAKFMAANILHFGEKYKDRRHSLDKPSMAGLVNG